MRALRSSSIKRWIGIGFGEASIRLEVEESMEFGLNALTPIFQEDVDAR